MNKLSSLIATLLPASVSFNASAAPISADTAITPASTAADGFHHPDNARPTVNFVRGAFLTFAHRYSEMAGCIANRIME